MDFSSILSIAAQNSSSGVKVQKKFSTDLAPPKKEKKDKKEVKSEAVRRLLQEKEKEKRAKSEAEKRKKEKELQRKKEEEKKKRFKIPKKDEDKSNKHEEHQPKVNKDKLKEQKEETREKKSSRKDLVLKPNEVRITALSSKGRETHLNHQYDFLLKKGIDIQAELQKEIKRREFEERKKQLLDKMKQGVIENKPEIKKEGIPPEEKKLKDEKRRREREAIRREEQRERELNGEHVRKRRRGMTDAELKEWMAKGDPQKSSQSEKGDKSSTHIHKPQKKISKINSGQKKPPPLHFGDLLKLAQTKASEVIEYDPLKIKKIKEKEPERLLTQVEIDRRQDEQLRHSKSSASISGHSSDKSNTPGQRSGKASASSLSSAKVPRIEESQNSSAKTISVKSSKHVPVSDSNSSKLKQILLKSSKHPSESNAKHSKSVSSSVISHKPSVITKNKQKHSSTSALKQSLPQSSNHRNSSSPTSKSAIMKSGRDIQSKHKSADISGAKKPRLDMKSSAPKVTKPDLSNSDRTRTMPEKSQVKLNSKPKDFRTYDSENEKVLQCGPTKKKMEERKAVSENPWDRIYGQIKKNNPAPVRKRRIEDYSDEEDDDDLDGFIDDDASDIDDDELLETDYSSHIRQIFGYDKRKYRYESDHEIKNMESSFREQMKEEARSARLGLLEDLEDIKKEEEEMKRKMAAKKKKK